MYSISQAQKTFDYSDAVLNLYEGASLGPEALCHILSRLLHSQQISYKERSIKWRNQLPSHAYSRTISELDQTENTRSWQLILDGQYSYLCLPLDHKTELVLSSENCELSYIDQNNALYRLLHHIGQALLLCHKVSQQKQENQALSEVLDHYPIPTLAVDNQLNTIFANKMARERFLNSPCCDEKNHITHLQNQAREHVDILKIGDSNSQRLALKNTLRECIAPLQNNSMLFKMTIAGSDSPLIISPSQNVPNEFKHYARSAIAWVYLLDASYSEQLKMNPFFLALDLSKAEKELCILLFEGKLLSDIAQYRRVSEQTVRKQLQSILRKKNLESQEALIIFLFEQCIECRLVK